MTLNDVQKAALVLFVAKEVQDSNSLSLMRGIALAVRNRVRAGMQGGNWLDVIENSGDYSGNDPYRDVDPHRLSVNDRALQMFARDIDSIFYGESRDELVEIFEGREMDGKRGDPILYWQFINRPLRQWFVENIVRDNKNHARRTQIGNVVFYT